MANAKLEALARMTREQTVAALERSGQILNDDETKAGGILDLWDSAPIAVLALALRAHRNEGAGGRELLARALASNVKRPLVERLDLDMQQRWQSTACGHVSDKKD
jgi:hypothetical protein